METVVYCTVIRISQKTTVAGNDLIEIGGGSLSRGNR